MARPRNFDPELALDAAMHAFWQEGFEAVSIDQLVAVTGASRHGLYADFGDKTDMVVKSLALYEQTVLRDLFKGIQGDGAGLPELRQFFVRMAKVARKSSNRSGCFMCNAYIELSDIGAVQAYTVDFFRRVTARFQQVLERAQLAGDLDASLDTLSLAHYLVGLIRGISANARSQCSDRAYQSYVQIGLIPIT